MAKADLEPVHELIVLLAIGNTVLKFDIFAPNGCQAGDCPVGFPHEPRAVSLTLDTNVPVEKRRRPLFEREMNLASLVAAESSSKSTDASVCASKWMGGCASQPSRCPLASDSVTDLRGRSSASQLVYVTPLSHLKPGWVTGPVGILKGRWESPKAAMEAARGRPAQLSAVSRDDIRHTLHTYFHSQAKTRQTSGPAAGSGRRRVHSFVQVQKKKVSLTNKRIFGVGSAVSKYYILCVSVQDGAGTSKPANAQLHYLQFLSTFAVDVRQSWDLGRLQVIENNGLTSEKKRGSFSLFFAGEDASWQWLVDDNEGKDAMHEFLWSLCALCVEQKKVMPRLVLINIEELNELAIHLSLQKKYGIEVDLLDHMAAMKKSALQDDPTQDNQLDAGDGKRGAGSNALSPAGAGARLSAAENDDAALLLADVNWKEAQLKTIDEDLRKKLRALEDENISFLLSFDGDMASDKGGKTAKAISAASAVGKIIVSIDTLLKRVNQMQEWTNESSEFMDETALSMQHFESLNNQLEVHFKNSVSLEETLERVIQTVEIPRDQMGVLLKPPSLFPGDPNDAAAASEGGVSARELTTRMQSTIATVQRLDSAIKSTTVFPVNEMVALRARGEELTKLAKAFCDKVCASWDAFLQRKTKQWLLDSRAATSSRNARTSPTKARAAASFVRDQRESSASVRLSMEPRMSRTLTSFDSDAKEMDWTFTNESFHLALIEYQQLFAHLQSLDARAMLALRLTYAKNVATVYGPHVYSLVRCLKEKLPRPSKHFGKPQSLQSWSFHLSSSQLGDALGASPLMQQALDHLVPIITREQHLLSMLFFPEHDDDNGASEPEELALLLESVFDKILKRLIDFGEAAAARNILDALALAVLVNGQLETYRAQSEFLFNVMVSFQLQMKRVLIKFTEDQEAWINGHHTDTRMAGVLSPILKTLAMIGRLEESVCGKVEDSTLASIYNRILPVTLQWLDKVSESKPKYTSMTRLENYLYISERLLAINSSPELPLAQYAATAQVKYAESLQRYTAYIWEYEFKQLVPFFNNIEDLLKTLPVQEIAFHAARQEARKALEPITTGFEKSAKSMHDRMKKHFSNNAKLLPSIWKHLIEYAKNRLSVYERIANDCYQFRTEPTAVRCIEMLQKFATS